MEPNPNETEEAREARWKAEAAAAGWYELDSYMSYRLTVCQQYYGHPRDALFVCPLYGQAHHLHLEFSCEDGMALAPFKIRSQEGARLIATRLEAEDSSFMHRLTAAIMKHPEASKLPTSLSAEETADLEELKKYPRLLSSWVG
jgi:hypothetical protein